MSFDCQSTSFTGIAEASYEAELECVVRGIMNMQPAEQESAVRTLLHLLVEAGTKLPGAAGSVPAPKQPPAPVTSVQAMPAEAFRLMEKAERELELFPMKHRVGIADDGSYFVRINVPEKVSIYAFVRATEKMLRSLPVDRHGCIIWKTPHFDPFDPATYV
jgi:hypothetical protein